MAALAPKACPICGKPSTEKFRPFCSARCADIDLNRWLTGAYVIPAGVGKTDADEEDSNPLIHRDDEDDNF